MARLARTSATGDLILLRRSAPKRYQRDDASLAAGKVSITDVPYVETKEQLGGFLVLEATDLNHAIQLMSKHPGVKAGHLKFVRWRTCQLWRQKANGPFNRKFKQPMKYTVTVRFRSKEARDAVSAGGAGGGGERRHARRPRALSLAREGA